MPTISRTALALASLPPEIADCSWCGKEVELLRKAGAFPPETIQAYVAFYQIFGTDYLALEEVAKLAGLSVEDTELSIMEAADWLMANSPYRSLPRRCSVCNHTQGPEDLAHLKEPLS